MQQSVGLERVTGCCVYVRCVGTARAAHLSLWDMCQSRTVIITGGKHVQSWFAYKCMCRRSDYI